MAEETKSHGGTQSDDEIIFKFNGNNIKFQPQPEPIDPFYGTGAEESTVPDCIDATLLYKIRENKSSAFRKDKDRYNGDDSTFISFCDDAERHLLKDQFSPSISLINGKNIFFQYPQLTVSEGRREVNCNFDPTIIDDDLVFYYTLLDSLDPDFVKPLELRHRNLNALMDTNQGDFYGYISQTKLLNPALLQNKSVTI